LTVLIKLKDKEKIITQPKLKKDERAEVAHWSRIKCTNLMECLNEELKRREKCFRIFPDEKSYLRLFGAILHRFSEDWISRKRLSS
jgi:transposase-like protein